MLLLLAFSFLMISSTNRVFLSDFVDQDFIVTATQLCLIQVVLARV